MKRTLCLLLPLLFLTGCTSNAAPTEATVTETPAVPTIFSGTMAQDTFSAPEYESRFDNETVILLSDGGITVDGGEETGAIYTSHDIIYYEDKDSYESGYLYGEGEDADKHTAQEAAAHTVINLTAPGAYRISGKLSAGQIRIDLGEDAYENPDAVVELILDNVDISCTVGPAILFLNVYECDRNWSADTATSEIDTSAAGANLILEGENVVSGSHVAKIFKDKEGEKKLWKQDGAIYSYMSMNVFGPGSLDLTADNEGLDTELHLTINGGNIAIRSGNDGINTNEDGVSVTTINGGCLHIIAGLGSEGDGIDSNGYLVINGGTVVASANPAADAGLDSDLGSYVNGGMVVALGSAMDWAESDSDQVTMNLQFAQYQSSGSAILVSDPDGKVVFAYDPSEDEILGENVRPYMGAILSCPGFAQGDSYYVFLDGTVSGVETGGVYSAVNAYEGGTQMQYTGTDVMMGPGGFRPGNFSGHMPEGEMPEIPEDFDPNRTEDFPMPEDFKGEPPEGFNGKTPEDFNIPEGFVSGMPGGFGPGQDRMDAMAGPGNALFYMQDKVNFFSGLNTIQ